MLFLDKKTNTSWVSDYKYILQFKLGHKKMINIWGHLDGLRKEWWDLDVMYFILVLWWEFKSLFNNSLPKAFGFS